MTDEAKGSVDAEGMAAFLDECHNALGFDEAPTPSQVIAVRRRLYEKANELNGWTPDSPVLATFRALLADFKVARP